MAEAFNTRHSCRSPGLISMSRGIVRIGNRHIIDGQILRRFAEAGAVIGCVPVAINQDLRHHRFRFSRRRIRIHEVLIANDEHSLRQARRGLFGALDSFNNQRARGSS